MIGEAVAPAWLQRDWLLGQFSKPRKRAIAKYIDFVRTGVGLPSLWGQLKNQIYLGDRTFVEQMREQVANLKELIEVPRSQRRAVAKPFAHYAACHPEPKSAMVEAYRSGDYSMKAIADYFGVHSATGSRAVRDREGK